MQTYSKVAQSFMIDVKSVKAFLKTLTGTQINLKTLKHLNIGNQMHTSSITKVHQSKLMHKPTILKKNYLQLKPKQ